MWLLFSLLLPHLCDPFRRLTGDSLTVRVKVSKSCSRLSGFVLRVKNLLLSVGESVLCSAKMPMLKREFH
ncbi:transcriptional regulator, RpiR family domain protein [Yersinia pestis]|nr:transcriptional regulator, RpiR family domain protein [Yersinia pestis]